MKIATLFAADTVSACKLAGMILRQSEGDFHGDDDLGALFRRRHRLLNSGKPFASGQELWHGMNCCAINPPCGMGRYRYVLKNAAGGRSLHKALSSESFGMLMQFHQAPESTPPPQVIPFRSQATVAKARANLSPKGFQGKSVQRGFRGLFFERTMR